MCTSPAAVAVLSCDNQRLTMRTKQRDVNTSLRRERATIADTALTLALTACPTLIVFFADSPFEPLKAAFLWTTASIAGAVVIGDLARRIKKIENPADSSWLRPWLAVAMGLVVAVIISTAVSDSPSLSWWGSGLRR